MNKPDHAAWARDVQAHMETRLGELLPQPNLVPERLHQAMRYAVLGGGKRVRPLLVHAAGELTGAEISRAEVVSASVEMIHAYSLVHDDMPCMDDDVLRRGKPTVHVQFDEATALLVGDALQALAFQIVAENRLCDSDAQQLNAITLLSHACGSRGMAGGQAIDLASVGKHLSLPELEFMHIHKTGALIRAAILMGAACGRPLDEKQQSALDRYAKCVGLAFQVVDDVLDAEASTATLGKTAGKDAKDGKPTYVSIVGAAQAKALADDLHGDALQAVEIFDHQADRLRFLADYIVKRQH
ncbi:MAG: polyprenyl synthetase family protein [Burkholderiales bacterium]